MDLKKTFSAQVCYSTTFSEAIEITYTRLEDLEHNLDSIIGLDFTKIKNLSFLKNDKERMPLLEWKYLEEKMNVIIELNDLIHFYQCSMRVQDEKFRQKIAEEQEKAEKFKQQMAEEQEKAEKFKHQMAEEQEKAEKFKHQMAEKEKEMARKIAEEQEKAAEKENETARKMAEKEKEMDEIHKRKIAEKEQEIIKLKSIKRKPIEEEKKIPDLTLDQFFRKASNILQLEFATPRIESLNLILNLVNEQKVILIKSPPQSGKSSLLNLLKVYVQNFRGISSYRIFPRNNYEREMTLNDVEECFHKEYPDDITFDELFNSKTKTLILIDETQMLYKCKNFWDLVKQKVDNAKLPIQIVCFAAYQGLRIKTNLTPIRFTSNNTFYMNLLGLKENEFKELFDDYNNFHEDHIYFIFDENLKNLIKKRIGNHVGLVYNVMQIIKNKYKYQIADRSTKTIENFMMSKVFYDMLMNERAFPSKRDCENLCFESSQILSAIFRWGELIFEGDKFLRKKARELEKTGFLMSEILPNLEKFKFASNIIGEVVYFQMFCPKIKTNLIKNPKQISLFQLCYEALKNMDGKRLKTVNEFKLAQKVKYLKEGQWQDEFYRCLCSVLSNEYMVLSEGGKEIGCEGEIDLYINSELQWGIELLREGQGLLEHQARFYKNGIYGSLVKDDYILIDFRSIKNKFVLRRKEESEKLLRVIYDEEFTGCQIFYEEIKREGISWI